MATEKYQYYLTSGLVGTINKTIRVVSQPLQLWLLVQILTPSLFGTYVLVQVIVNITTEIAGLGFNNLILHRVPKIIEDDTEQARSIVGQVLLLGVISVLTASLILIFFRKYFQIFFGGDYLTSWLFWLALLAPISTIRDFHAQWLKANERMKESFLISGIIPNPTRVICLAVVWWYGFGIPGIITALFVERFCSLLPWLIREQLFKNLNVSTLKKDDYVYSVQLVGSRLTTLMNINLDILMIGWLGTSSMTGIYKVGSSIAGAIRHVHGLMGTIFKPRLSRFIGSGETKKLKREFSVLQRINVSALLWALIGLISLGIPVLRLFGSTYVKAFPVILIIFMGRIFQLGSGEAGSVLVYSGRSGFMWILSFVVFITNFVGNYFLIQWIGIEGAAWAWGASIALSQIMALMGVNYYKGLQLLPLEIAISMGVMVGVTLSAVFESLHFSLLIVILLPFAIYFTYAIYPKFRTMIELQLLDS